ncbi:MAG: aldo/keto reductase [Anaerolineales bacterium]|nr:MAG: aldo/keto reductase [Anaerolineales bacterium]
MEYRKLGRTGVRVSPLCLGTMNFGGPTSEGESIKIIETALEAGVNFIDTANMYNAGESERVVGKALSGGARNRVILATKVHFPQSNDPNDRGNSRRHIVMAVEDSLRRLQTDWIDLYQIHRPMFEIPAEETLRALDDLIHQGKVRYIGSSTFPAWFIMESLSVSEKLGLNRYVTEQPPYNILDRRIENELVPLALRYDIGLLPWSPLAMGMLAGRYKSADELPESSRAQRIGTWAQARITNFAISRAEQVVVLARNLSITPSQLSLAWVKDQPGVTAPIIGPRSFRHLEDALRVLEISLNNEIMQAIDEIVPPGSAAADFHNTSGWMRMKLGL